MIFQINYSFKFFTMATRTTGRIVIPTRPADLLEVAQKIFDKHVADGAASPLHAQQDFKWSVEGPKIAACTTSHEEAEKAARLAEQHYRQRDVDLPALKAIVQNSAQLLKSIYAKNPKILGEYGLNVDDTKQTKPPKE